MSIRDDLLKRIDGRPVIVSISGGKDSTACSLHLRELGIEHTLLHMSTGWEHPQTEEYLAAYLPSKLGPITVLGGETMEERIVRLGAFPARNRRWCTMELKIQRFVRFVDALDDEPLVVIGIRHLESAKRATMSEWDTHPSGVCDVWRPLVSWTVDDVVAIHHRHDVLPNPLYTRSHERVGCWPCINASKAEIRRMADDPILPLAKRLQPLEESQQAIWTAKVNAMRHQALGILHDGGTVEDAARALGKTRQIFPGQLKAAKDAEAHLKDGTPLDARPCPIAWFHAKGRGPMKVQDAISWSKTNRSKQFEMFASSKADRGCMRWGLCDTGATAWDSPCDTPQANGAEEDVTG